MKKPEQYYNEIKYLIQFIPGGARLPSDAKQTVITDSFIKLHSKMKEGILNADDYEIYKHYMFITVKNNIIKYYQQRQTTTAGIGQRIFIDEQPIESIIIQSTESNTNNDTSHLKAILNQLKPIDRAVLRWYSRGWTYDEIAKAVGITRPAMSSRITIIRRKLKKLLSRRYEIK